MIYITYSKRIICKEEIKQMSLQVEKLEKSMAKLTIEVSAEEFEAALNKAYQKNKAKITWSFGNLPKIPLICKCKRAQD